MLTNKGRHRGTGGDFVNWDLIVGLVIGLSGSIIALIGTIVVNRQNNAHQMELTRIQQAHEKEMSEQKYNVNKEMEYLRLAIENSFQAFEVDKEHSHKHGEYDSGSYEKCLLVYTKLANRISKSEKLSNDELTKLLNDLVSIKSTFNSYDHYNLEDQRSRSEN